MRVSWFFVIKASEMACQDHRNTCIIVCIIERQAIEDHDTLEATCQNTQENYKWILKHSKLNMKHSKLNID